MKQSVIPAKAGIQSVNHIFKEMLKTWIPAFAGMTAGVVIMLVLVAPSASAAFFGSPATVEEIREKLARLPEQGAFRAKATAHSELGTLLYKRGEMAAAAAEFEEALVQHPPRSLRGHIYLYMGKSYESSGRLDKAITAYEQAAVYESKIWRRHRDLARLYEQAQLYRKAIASYEDALKRNPKEPSAMLQLGRTWREMGFNREAERYLDQALESGAETREVNRELSFVYEGEGRFSEAVSAWQRGLGEAPTPENIARTIYLAFLSGEGETARKGFGQLKSLGNQPLETIQFYENLVELTGFSPEQILAQVVFPAKAGNQVLNNFLKESLRTEFPLSRE